MVYHTRTRQHAADALHGTVCAAEQRKLFCVCWEDDVEDDNDGDNDDNVTDL